MEKLIRAFVQEIAQNNVEVYNEFSLQHELGIFLRNNLNEFKVEFERNVSHFGLHRNQFIKKEIDISIFNEHDLNTIIELKYPQNGQVPEQMYSFIKDLKFLEQLHFTGHFKKGYLLIITPDPLFYRGGKLDGIYKYFRDDVLIMDDIFKPTGPNSGIESISVIGPYAVTWEALNENLHYCLLEVPAI